MIIAKAVKLTPYLNYSLDKEMVIIAAIQSCTAVKEDLDKNPEDTTYNRINFLNNLSEEYLRAMGIKDKIIVTTWAKKVVGKH